MAANQTHRFRDLAVLVRSYRDRVRYATAWRLD